MKIPSDLSHAFNKYEALAKPVVFFSGKLYVLTAGDGANLFGGPMPRTTGIASPEVHRLVLTIDLESLGVSIPNPSIPSRIPLIFNFDLESLTSDYYLTGETIDASSEKCFFGNEPAEDDPEFPYSDFPDEFPQVSLRLESAHDISFKQFEELCTSQGLTGSYDEPDVSGHLFAIAPQYKEFGVGIWSEDESGQIGVFDINPHSGRVEANNQCT